MLTITVNENDYELKYNLQRIELLENNSKTALMYVLNTGAISITNLKMYIAYGIKNVDGGYLQIKDALIIAEQMIRELGYMKALENFATAITEDCGFLFPSA